MEKSDYKEVNGTFYHKETLQSLIDILEQARNNHVRITVDYGDTKTGKSWNEEHDITGYVGRSTGNIKVPLLIYNNRSTGGAAMLDHCIIKVMESRGKRILWRHPSVKK